LTKIVAFENALDDLITEMLTEEDIKEFETYFGDTTIMSLIKQAFETIRATHWLGVARRRPSNLGRSLEL